MEQDVQQTHALRTSQITYTQYRFFFDEEIGSPSGYRDLIEALLGASETDEFILYFNSQGGNLDSAMAIVEAMRLSQADEIKGILLGECHSAASIIALNCHKLVITRSASMMVHTASVGTGMQTIANVHRYTDFTRRAVERVIDETYKGFLTEEELCQVKTGVEFWFDAEEIERRIAARHQYLQSIDGNANGD